MRLIRLDLERYGPFTGTTLTFRPDVQLHVVLGENEAGKSCALAALTDLFFGIERQTRYDFRHEGKELRIGAEIVSRDGRRLDFVRKKHKPAVAAVDGAVLGEEALAPFLGGLTREVFCRAFGLNATTLRDGAEEMLKSDGDVGAALFAAASGLRGMTELRRNLETEADAIFSDRRAQHRRFYQTLDRFEEARRGIRDGELKAADWKALNARIETLAVQLDGINLRVQHAAAEHARISRLKRLAPQLALIDADLRCLDELGGLPAVPSGFAARLRSALDDVERCRDALSRSRLSEEAARRDHGSITVDNAVLSAAAEVEQLFAETGAYAAEQRDLPRVQGEAEGFHAALGELATRLGLSGPDEIEARHPSDAAKALVRRLIADGRSIRIDADGKREQLRIERRAVTELERQRAQRGTLADPKPLRDRLAAIAPVLRQIQRRGELDLALRVEQQRLAEAAGRLTPPVAAVDTIARAALPSAETVARCRTELDSIGEGIRRAEDRVADAEETARAAEARRQPLTAAGPLPSPAAIAELRAERDRIWRALRAALFGAPEAINGAELAEATTAFERLKADADRLADQAVVDAKRVADHDSQTRIVGEAQRSAQLGREAIAILQQTLAQARAGWLKLWADAGVSPLSPAEMHVWLSGVASLLERHDRIAGLRAELSALDERIAGIEPALRSLARDLALQGTEGLDPELLAQHVEARLGELDTAWNEARELDTLYRETVTRTERLGAEADEIGRREAEWRSEWEPALAAAGFPPALGLEEAEAVLQAWDEVPTTLRERANRQARVAGMLRNVHNFEAAVARLADLVGAEVSGLPAQVVVKSLSERLGSAGRAQARQAEAAKRLAGLEGESRAAEHMLADAEAALARLGADLPGGADLHLMSTQLARRDELWEALAEKRTQFTTQAEGLTEAAIRAELLLFDRDQAEASLRRLTDEQQRLAEEANVVFADHRDAERDREALQQGTGAELAAQQRRGAEAELASVAREWAVLKLAALLLGEAMERHRAGQQDPLMRRSGDLFAMVTGGSFTELVQDYDDHDVPRLAGRRPSGSLVPIAGMSEGARDQLYLALRLAYLEDYSARAEPAPFIGDDLFATFDDRRTFNGLKAFAAIGEHVQPILFTHHRHVADAAVAALGARAEVLELQS